MRSRSLGLAACPRSIRVFTTFIVLVITASGAQAGTGFRNSSLFGTFATIGAGDGHTSASVGTATYDGAGNVTRSIVVNAPDGNGGRRLITFEGTGTYTVRPDGTGVMSIT